MAMAASLISIWDEWRILDRRGLVMPRGSEVRSVGKPLDRATLKPFSPPQAAYAGGGFFLDVSLAEDI